MKAFDYDLKLGPVAVGVLMVLALLGVIFFALNVHRVRTLHRVDYTSCAQYQTYMDVSKCVGIKVRDYLKHPQWRAAQFACYMLASIIGGIFCAWITGGQRRVAVPLIAAIAGLGAAVMFNPWGLVAISAFLGVPLGGLFFRCLLKDGDRRFLQIFPNTCQNSPV